MNDTEQSCYDMSLQFCLLQMNTQFKIPGLTCELHLNRNILNLYISFHNLSRIV